METPKNLERLTKASLIDIIERMKRENESMSQTLGEIPEIVMEAIATNDIDVCTDGLRDFMERIGADISGITRTIYASLNIEVLHPLLLEDFDDYYELMNEIEIAITDASSSIQHMVFSWSEEPT